MPSVATINLRTAIADIHHNLFDDKATKDQVYDELVTRGFFSPDKLRELGEREARSLVRSEMNKARDESGDLIYVSIKERDPNNGQAAFPFINQNNPKHNTPDACKNALGQRREHVNGYIFNSLDILRKNRKLNGPIVDDVCRDVFVDDGHTAYFTPPTQQEFEWHEESKKRKADEQNGDDDE